MATGIQVNPDIWTTRELGLIFLYGSLYLLSLTYAIWQGCRAASQRWYWICCAILIVAGTLTMIYAVPDAPDSGEMPRQFGLGVWPMLFGLLGAVAGIAAHALRRLFMRPGL
ncbi:hypothetical protein BCF11_1944 [Collimonas sp. PA-H2]|uniref:hypothetical protein n=1 Tax=Collimonas sp. PA-H2 TaxID=1881062 RepID=UPI000BF87F89|nr:hypothetical protein [Collimonas sp. PA-H2]PFH09547.1 hypothetical protein BCF11_1944 [Collimonas sp. PA-H2]